MIFHDYFICTVPNSIVWNSLGTNQLKNVDISHFAVIFCYFSEENKRNNFCISLSVVPIVGFRFFKFYVLANKLHFPPFLIYTLTTL